MRRKISIAWQTDKPLSAYGPLAAQAEAYGFDVLSVYNDLFFQPAWYPLLEMARHTSRAVIGPAAVNPFTCHPVHIAGQLALLDEASNGRAYLGLARGAWLETIAVRPKQPIAALREAFAAIRHLLERSGAPLSGDHFPLPGQPTLRWPARLNAPEIPFLLGSWGRQTISTCLPALSEVKLGGTTNPAIVTALRQWLPAQVKIVVGAVSVVDEDARIARALARREVALYLPVIAALDKTLAIEPMLLAALEHATTTGNWDAASALISDELLAKLAFAGSPTGVAVQVEALLAAGADRIEFGTPHGLSMAAGLRLLGEEVLPILKAGA